MSSSMPTTIATYDLDIESVNVLIGHASTKTTESFYSRKRMTKAVESAKRTWDEDGGQ